MKPGPPVPAWRIAVSMFTVIPAGGPPEVSREQARRIVLWMPAIGAVLGLTAAGVLLGIEAGGGSAPRRLLAATVAIGALGLLTGGLHLDGLADTADGIGSRRPRAEALDIMRRSDIGPMGVTALLLLVLVQVTALATLPAGWPGAVAIGTAVITSRVAVVRAAPLPAAREQGFGALVAGATTRRSAVLVTAALLATVAVAGALAGGPILAARGLSGVIAGLLAAAWLSHVARKRLGGMTGDVFGALIEVSMAAALLAFALPA